MAPMVIMVIISALEIISRSLGKEARGLEGKDEGYLFVSFGFTSGDTANLTV